MQDNRDICLDEIGQTVQTRAILVFQASLLLLSGDICPNPGWAYSVLNSPGLKIAHLNIRSLPKHLDEFKILMADNPFDAMCLSETWLNSTWSDNELHIDGYNIIRRDHDDSQRGGGTAIYYSTKFMARQRSDLSIPDIETVWLELTLPNRKKTPICSLYKPPINANFDAFKASLDNVLDQSASEGVETLILGDFNCDMLSKRCPRISKELMQLLNMYQLNQLIKESTHISEHFSTTIDLAFTNDAEKIIKSGVLQCSISNHSLIFLTRRAKKLRSPGKNIQYRNF